MNTNAWNRLRYTLIQPIYNPIARLFEGDRQRAIELLALQPDEQVLILGCGSGLDLAYIPQGVKLTAIDITPAMVAKTRQQAQIHGHTIQASVMDGQALTFEAAQFDAVILNLILAVIPDPNKCIQETERVLKTGGRAVIFDKFLPPNTTPSLGRRGLNLLTNTLFSDINRQLKPILAQTNLQIDHEEPAPAWQKLNYSITLVHKP